MVIILCTCQLNIHIQNIHLFCHASAYFLDVMCHLFLIWFKSPHSPEALQFISGEDLAHHL